jgi:hypothetical protein
MMQAKSTTFTTIFRVKSTTFTTVSHVRLWTLLIFEYFSTALN